MKEQQTSETISAISEVAIDESDKQDLKNLIEYQGYMNDSGTGYTTQSSTDSLYTEVSTITNKDESDDELCKASYLSDEETIRIIKETQSEIKNIPEEQHREWLLKRLSSYYSSVMPKSLVEHYTSFFFKGDTGISVDVIPEWLDIDKFRRGQKFVLDETIGMLYANLLSMFLVLSTEDGLKPLIFTDASSTPYTSFKRYFSTAMRFHNWFSSDPWTAGTPAYNDIRTVRRIHALIRKRIEETPVDEYIEKTKIKEPWCPALDKTKQDMESVCPEPKAGQCPYMAATNFPELHQYKLSQGEMSATQFAFTGLHILYPKFFGMHDATEEDLEAYCHLWRGIGYLLGIGDEFNFCRGTLEEVKTRSRDIIDYWVRPNLRVVTPEWEHMMRCMVEGVTYYFPASTYETCLLDIAKILNVQLPRIYNSLSYSDWIRHNLTRFYFDHATKLSGLKTVLNRQVNAAMVRTRNYDERKHQELKERSAKTIDSYLKQLKKDDLIFGGDTFPILMCTVILFFSVLIVFQY